MKKFIEFILKLLGFKREESESGGTYTPSEPSAPSPPPMEVKEEGELEVKEPKEEEIEQSRIEPKKTKKKGTVDTFLWKPKADHSNLPVVVVSADNFKSEDLFVEIVGKGKKVLKIDIRNSARANMLPGFEFGRIHFRINRSGKELNKSAPLKVRFYRKEGGEKIPVKVRGRKSITIKKPTHRKDLK